ncbi:uncharacterized protein MONOS_17265 [Monocercomonoides exilis]|uniref:uncharacterized protein n=1 Tax=Monocercomonoides exilis TaxID=2049356 RepID=UPI003559E4F7|nr:hypothetical protein MONOS_17265 [Monocercomonoides exilis]
METSDKNEYELDELFNLEESSDHLKELMNEYEMLNLLQQHIQTIVDYSYIATKGPTRSFDESIFSKDVQKLIHRILINCQNIAKA